MTRIQLQAHDGTLLAADVNGAPRFGNILLFHGAGQTRHSWRSTGLMLAQAGYRAINVDLRGHGESGWSAQGNYAFEDLSRDVQAVLQAFEGPSVVVGASAGGLGAMLAAGEDPDPRQRGLVLVDIVPHFDQAGGLEIESFMRAHADGFDTVEAASQAIASYLPYRNRNRPAGSTGLMRNLRTDARGRLQWHWDPAFLAARTAELETGFLRLESAMQRVAVPTLLIYGANSRVVTPAAVERFRTLRRDAELVAIAGAEHMVAGDDNEQFNVPLLDFLKRTLDTAGAAINPGR